MRHPVRFVLRWTFYDVVIFLASFGVGYGITRLIVHLLGRTVAGGG